MEVLGYMVAFLFVIVFNNILRGLVLSILWGWFITRLGVVDIGIAEAIGISTVVSYLTWKISRDSKSENVIKLTKEQGRQKLDEVLASAVWQAILLSAFFLAFGWVVHLFL